MLNEELAATFEEEVTYDANPNQVISALRAVKDRVRKYRSDEPGDYREADPTCYWHTGSPTGNRWRIGVSLYRTIQPEALPSTATPTAVVSQPVTLETVKPEPVPAEPVAAQEPSHALEIESPAPPDERGSTQPAVRKEGRNPTVSRA